MSARSGLLKTHWVLSSQFGIDLLATVRSLRGLPKYLVDLRRFRTMYTGRLELRPCLRDWFEEGGTTKSEYFWQDLLVARMIFAANPKRHIDIGSRVDGFVAHVASFREIEVFDLRPITSAIPGIRFTQADLMKPGAELAASCDSLSCLHALEHFGLGRYGDPLDPRGFENGLVEMGKLLKEDGIFYLSTPIGIERVEFNAHRVSDPRFIVSLATKQSLTLLSLTVIKSDGQVDVLAGEEAQLARLAGERYALGIFVFRKRSGDL